MEKMVFTAKKFLTILLSVVVVIAMFLNWYPVDLELGGLQLGALIGKINAFTLSGKVFEIEDRLGVLAELLPDGFAALKTWSVVLTVLASVTVILYLCTIVFNLLKKDNYIDMISFAAAVGAIVTAILFSKVVKEVYSVTGVAAAGYNALTVLSKTSWLIALLGSAVTMAFTETIEYAILGFIIKLREAAVKLIAYIVEWIRVLTKNVAFLISDIAGAVVGIWFGKTIYYMSEMAFVGVIAGLAAAGVIAAVCCVVADKVFAKR